MKIYKDLFLPQQCWCTKFRSVVCHSLRDFSVKQVNEDADQLVVVTALKVSQEHDKVVVVGENTDLFIIFFANIYFSKPGRGTIPSKVFGSNSFKFADVRRSIIFPHAISGYDTTSALLKLGKKKAVMLLI